MTSGERAKAGEDAFQRWLDHNGFAYVRVCQDPKSFAKLFRSNVKRPDFLVLIDSIGLLAVDVKNKSSFGSGYSLSHDKEWRLAIAFERIFRLPVWYAYQGVDDDAWYWISALKAVEVGEEKKNRDGELFLELGLKHFACVHSREDFGQLYQQQMTMQNQHRWKNQAGTKAAPEPKHTGDAKQAEPPQTKL